MSKKPTIALIGNPNSGKTAVFNQLTGLAQKVSNYPGVTVEKHVGKIRISEKDYNVTDYPGIYGIVPNSLDEKIVCEEILNWCTNKESSPDLIVCVLDANNISRNLYLATQILEIGIPTIFALNMIDLLQESNKNIDASLLKEKLNVYDVVTCCALNSKGLIDLTQSISQFFNTPSKIRSEISILDEKTKLSIEELTTHLKKKGMSENQSRLYAINIVSNSNSLEIFENSERSKIKEIADNVILNLEEIHTTTKSLNSIIRYQWLEKLFDKYKILINLNKTTKKSFTEKLDKYLTHPILGTGIF